MLLSVASINERPLFLLPNALPLCPTALCFLFTCTLGSWHAAFLSGNIYKRWVFLHYTCAHIYCAFSTQILSPSFLCKFGFPGLHPHTQLHSTLIPDAALHSDRSRTGDQLWLRTVLRQGGAGGLRCMLLSFNTYFRVCAVQQWLGQQISNMYTITVSVAHGCRSL